MDTVCKVQWAVRKALAPVADGVLEAWVAGKNLGLDIEALKMELLLVQATLETAGGKEIEGRAVEVLLQKLRDSVHSADDLLDELDYFRIHDQLHGTHKDGADQHANTSKGCIHSLVLNARHTIEAAGKLACLPSCCSAASPENPRGKDAAEKVSCCSWPAKHMARANSSSVRSSNQADDEVLGCVPKLGKLLLCSSSTHVHDDDGTPKLGFNMVDASERMKFIVEELQLVRRAIITILQSSGPNTVQRIAQSRPITTSHSVEPKLYGRDHIVNSIIYDMIKGKYFVLPIVGPGGIGKTTLIQQIYQNQEAQNHFQVRIWVCVSLSFDLNKLLEEIKRCIPRVKGEKEGTAEEVIVQRLKSKKFLLVLDDIWGCSNEEWENLLRPLKQSEAEGSMVVVTTRFPAIAQMIKSKTSDISVELAGLDLEEFQKLFFSFVFDDEKSRTDNSFLLETGYKIMEKLKGSPLAAKTVARLLKADLNLRHWRRVLESKEWEGQTADCDIMPALKLSYDYLPYHQQQCFSYSALFPEDYKYSSSQLINFWIGLDIFHPDGHDETLEHICLRTLNDLVMHGFFREEKTNGRLQYVMHDLLHDLAKKVASDDCLTLHLHNVRSVKLRPYIRHLSIIIDDVGDDNAVFGDNFKIELRELKRRLKVGHLQSLMLFGKMDESYVNICGDLFREANALRVLHLLGISYPVESILHNFSGLLHLRYLFLGTEDMGQMHRFLCLGTEYESQMHVPLTISKFYHLKILDLGSWYGRCDFPKDMSNLQKLYRFYTQKDELHSAICNVGKLKHLQELKVFRVNKESEGFEPKQLEHLTGLRELGIYNLENIHTKEEADEAKLIEKKFLERLTLGWDSKRSNPEPDVEAVVLESLQPHRDLQELCITGHGGPSCPTWLGDVLTVKALHHLHLVDISWDVLPSLGQIRYLRKLILEDIAIVKKFVIEENFQMLIWLELVGLECFEKWVLSQCTHVFPLLQVLIIRDCPKLLDLPFSNHTVHPFEQDRYIDWFPKLQDLEIVRCPELLPVTVIPWTKILCHVNIRDVKLLEKFVYSKSSDGVELKIIGTGDLHSLDQVLAFDNLADLEELELVKCPPLELKHLVMLTSLKTLITERSDALVGPLGQSDIKWQVPVEHIEVQELFGNSGKELTELLTHLPRLSKLEIMECGKMTHLAAGMDLRKPSSAASEVEEDEIPPPPPTAAAGQQKEEDEMLLFPAHLSNSLQELVISHCPGLVLVSPSTLLPDGHINKKGGGGLQALRSLQILKLKETPRLLSAYSFSSPSFSLFPSSLQFLELNGVEGMGTVEPLSNLTSLTQLELRNCGEDLRCKGLEPLLTAGGRLTVLIVYGSPRFFGGWDLNPRRVLQEQPQLVSLLSSSTLRVLRTDDTAGFLAAPICSLLSSSLTQLHLFGIKEMERFTKEQEKALYLLTSLQELEFFGFDKLKHLPEGMHKLANLKELRVDRCPSVRSLPMDGLPKSLQKLDVSDCCNEEIIHQCRGLVGTIAKVRLEF